MNDRNRDYVFLSYSHTYENADGLAKLFDDKGYNIVYDKAMSYGEEWDLNARRYISNEKCKGVICLVNEAALKSKPVLIEISYAVQFHKKYFPIVAGDVTMGELFASASMTQDENEQYIVSCMMDYFKGELLYVRLSHIDWAKIAATFKGWGFECTRDEEIVKDGYTSKLKGEKERLLRQARGYYDFDMSAIDLALSTFTRDDLTVLDLGCSNGEITVSRFADNKRIKKVIGVDYNQDDIEEAKKLASAYGDKFSFYCLDLESAELVQQLADILKENGIQKIDIVFAALVLHHLKDPRLLLLRLYDIFSDDGKIIVRGSDDGGKLCYPENELLQEILARYASYAPSDRINGRKLYGLLYNTGYVGIKMLYSVTDTCEKNRPSKEHMFKVGFGYRLNSLDHLISLNPDNEKLLEERKWLADALIKLEQAFCERDFWYCNTSYIAIAGVK